MKIDEGCFELATVDKKTNKRKTNWKKMASLYNKKKQKTNSVVHNHGRIDHEHIVRLYGVVLDTNALMLVSYYRHH